MAVQFIDPLSRQQLEASFNLHKQAGSSHMLVVEPHSTVGSEFIVAVSVHPEVKNDGDIIKTFRDHVKGQLVGVHYLGAKNFRDSTLAL